MKSTENTQIPLELLTPLLSVTPASEHLPGVKAAAVLFLVLPPPPEHPWHRCNVK